MKPFAGIKIIIAEDEQLLRGILRDEFEYYGAQVIEAANGHIAFDEQLKQNAHVIISDVRMPHGDGLELLDKLRRAKKLPLFFFSTAFTDVTEEEAQSRGAIGLFNKPYDLRVLIDAVATALKKPGMAA